MNVKDIQAKIQIYSDRTEAIFLNLAERFPMLLKKEEGSSMDSLLNLFDVLQKANSTCMEEENVFLNSYDKKYEPLFEALNKRIEELSTVNSNVREIKDNSEEMELIALNAMVISIKSGERGRAFSSITENLKQLSTDMNMYSNKLLEEEEQLLKQINALKSVFDGLTKSQHSLSSVGSSSSTNVNNLIQKASNPLLEIKDIINSVYSPIQKAMEGLQLQDIIRQALNHVLLCLKESAQFDQDFASDEEALDKITFNIAVFQLSTSVLEDICENIKKSIDIFKSNWIKVAEILRSVEPKRIEYMNRFLDKQRLTEDNIQLNMARISDSFDKTMVQFGVYMSNQKTLERNCSGITEKAQQMYAVFEALKPIIRRLHHVRILQQIEVAKNPAIVAVKDSVTDMDNLIGSANKSIDEMQDMLVGFISSIRGLIADFTQATNSDSAEMNKVRLAKTSFLTEFHTVQDGLSSILGTFNVFPPGFEQLCITVQNKLDELEEIYNDLRVIIVSLSDEKINFESRRKQMMQNLGLLTWDLKDDKLKDLVTHFTITAHKEEAGQIGHFGVENGTEAGEITFF